VRVLALVLVLEIRRPSPCRGGLPSALVRARAQVPLPEPQVLPEAVRVPSELQALVPCRRHTLPVRHHHLQCVPKSARQRWCDTGLHILTVSFVVVSFILAFELFLLVFIKLADLLVLCRQYSTRNKSAQETNQLVLRAPNT
jgi:hypothetical protein